MKVWWHSLPCMAWSRMYINNEKRKSNSKTKNWIVNGIDNASQDRSWFRMQLINIWLLNLNGSIRGQWKQTDSCRKSAFHQLKERNWKDGKTFSSKLEPQSESNCSHWERIRYKVRLLANNERGYSLGLFVCVVCSLVTHFPLNC